MSVPSPIHRAATPGPRVNGRYMQLFAAAVNRLPEPDRAAVRGKVPAAIWDSIERVGLLGWLPGEANLLCTRAVAETLGPDRAHAFFQSLLSTTFQAPLLRGIVEGALRFGFRDLVLYVPWMSKGFELLFQGCGRWAVAQRGNQTAMIEIKGLPHAYLTDPYWLQSVASSTSALFALVRTTGTATVEDVDVPGARATFRVRWAP